MSTHIVGSSFYPQASRLIPRMRIGQRIALVREKANKYDKNAVAVHIVGVKCGHLSRAVAADLAPLLDGGVAIIATKVAPVGTGMIRLDWDDNAIPARAPSRAVSEKFQPPKPPRPIGYRARQTFPEIDLGAAIDEGPDPWE